MADLITNVLLEKICSKSIKFVDPSRLHFPNDIRNELVASYKRSTVEEESTNSLTIMVKHYNI